MAVACSCVTLQVYHAERSWPFYVAALILHPHVWETGFLQKFTCISQLCSCVINFLVSIFICCVYRRMCCTQSYLPTKAFNTSCTKESVFYVCSLWAPNSNMDVLCSMSNMAAATECSRKLYYCHGAWATCEPSPGTGCLLTRVGEVPGLEDQEDRDRSH